jgi:ubiquinone/menaquinone biosynthesis C-methylase UbiE
MEPMFWALYARSYDRLAAYYPPYAELVCDVCAAVRENAGGSGQVVDIGCGTGNLSVSLAGLGYKVLGLDFSPGMLRRARAKATAGTSFVRADLGEGLPLPDASVDVVTCVHALYVMTDPVGLVREAARVLRDDGVLVLVTMQRAVSPLTYASDLFGRLGLAHGLRVGVKLLGVQFWNLVIDTRAARGSYALMEEQRLRDCLDAAGFRVVSVAPTYTTGASIMAVCTKGRD